MASSTSLRVLSFPFLLAACAVPAFDPDEREEADYPEGAVLWQLERYLDQNGNIPPQAWQTALQARAVTVAAAAAVDNGGISPLAWTQRGPDNVAGRCRSIAIDPRNPQRIWAGAVSGGLWRSDNGGTTWTQVDDWWRNLSVGCLTLDPQNPDVIYVGTGEGFYSLAHLARNLSHFVRGAGVMKSSDGGVTWTQLPGTANWQCTTRIAVAPNNSNILLASRRPGGISRSTDGGLTWTDVTPALVTAPFSWQVAFDPNDGSKAVAHLAPGSVASHGVITSTDGGLTWQAAQSGLASVAGETSRIELAYARSAPGMVYAATGAGSGKVWRSTDGGRNWTQQTATTNLAISYYYDGLWVDPTNANTLVVTALVAWRSTDGGVTFTQISNGYIMTTDPHPDVHTVVADPGYDGGANRRVYLGTDGGIHVADDILAAASGGAGWRDLDATMRSTQFYGAAAHATNDVIVAGAQDNGTLRIVGSSPLANMAFGGDGGQVQIDPTNPNYVYGEYVYAQVHRSSNGGTSSGNIYSGITDAGAAATANFISPMLLDPNLATRLYVGAAQLWRSNNARNASLGWAAVKPSVGSLISAVAVAPGFPDQVWVGHNDGRLYRTTNGTNASPTWTAVDDNGAANPLPNRVLTRLAVDPTNPAVVYASFGGFAADNLWRSANAGATWQAIAGAAPTALPPAPVYGLAVLPDDPTVLYAATEVGVYASDDAGAHWSTSNDGPANVVCEEVAFVHNAVPRRLVVATVGRGLWTATIQRPSAVAYGTACTGQASPPVLGVDPQAPARLGRVLGLTGTNLRSGQPLAFAVLGLSDQAWAGGALPFPLDGLGMPGCALQTSVDLSLVAVPTGTTAQWSVALPGNAQFLGVRLFVQMLALDPGINAAGMVVSRPLAVTTGW